MNNYDRNEKFREICYIGDLELLRTFYNQQKPDLNSQNKVNGWTALHWSAKKNHIDIVKFLLDKGASKELKNNDGKTAGSLSTDPTIRSLLGADPEVVALTLQNEEFIPNYKKHPEFHYANSGLFSLEQQSSSSSTNNKPVEPTTATTVNSLARHKTIQAAQVEQHNENGTNSRFTTIKIRTNLDEDFVEIDFDRLNTNFEAFKEMCINEFVDYVDIDFGVMKLDKIRKLPNVLIRNTNDVKRLKEDQSVEFFFVNKNTSNLI